VFLGTFCTQKVPRRRQIKQPTDYSFPHPQGETSYQKTARELRFPRSLILLLQLHHSDAILALVPQTAIGPGTPRVIFTCAGGMNPPLRQGFAAQNACAAAPAAESRPGFAPIIG